MGRGCVVEGEGRAERPPARRRPGGLAPALAGVVLALLPGAVLCAPASAAEVRVVGERAGVEGCDALGEVRGSSLMGMILDTAGWESVVDEMKERALALGATHLLLQEVRNGVLGSSGRGEAFACPPEPIPAPQPRPRRRR